MYTAVLSVLLMGVVPAWDAGDVALPPAAHLTVAVPAAAKLQGLAQKMTSSGVLIVDLQSAQPIYAENIDRHRAMASLAKLMTAVLIVENHDMDEVVTVPREATRLDGQRYLKSGDRFTVGDLLSALLVSSANDAAYTLAQYHSGSQEAFAAEMNRRARVLGLDDTSFANAVGFDDSRQWSTPRDIAWLAAFALRFPVVRMRMSMPVATIRSMEGNVVALSHTHDLLHTQTAVVAGKTGTTQRAGECLVSVVEHDGREYLVVLLHATARYADMQVVLRALSDLPSISAVTRPAPPIL